MMAVRRSLLWLTLFLWGCATGGAGQDFTFVPTTDQTFPEVEEAKLYRSGVGKPHIVIGEVTVLGEPDEPQEALEQRLLEGARKFGAQGVIVVEAGRTVSETGKAGIRYDDTGGASTRYRIHPAPLDIEEEHTYMRGRAIRFIEE